MKGAKRKLQNITKRGRKEKGITLVSLVITVVVIIILAIITINFLFGENGLITKTQEAKKMSNIESTREKLEMATGTAVIDGAGTTSMDEYIDIIVKEEIVGSKEDVTDDDGDGVYEIITNDGFIFEATPVPDKDNAEDIILEYVGLATGPRIRKINATTTTNNARIEVEAVNAENGIFTYEYKKEGESSWQVVEGEAGSTCMIENLEAKQIYNIRVTLEVKSGKNKGIATRETSILTGEMPEGAITFEQETWQGDGTASVVVKSSQEGYTIQYQIVETGSITTPEELEATNWKAIGNGEAVTGVKHNQTVYARLWDGHNGSSYANADVKDESEPVVRVSSSNVTTNSATLTVEASDGQSGLAEEGTYKYYLNEETTAKETSTSNSYNFTGLAQGTTYTLRVVVTDRAGNTKEVSTTVQTETLPGGEEAIKQGAITFGETKWSNNLASITVSTNTNNKIQYQVNAIEENGWREIANGGTIGNLSYPSMVYARLYDGTNYGSYASASIEDKTTPQDATIGLSSTNVTTGTTVTATVMHRDNESGPEITQCKYIWNTSNAKLGLDPGSYTGGTFSSNGQQVSMNMISPATYYLHVLTVDRAGNKWETVSNGITVRQLATGITVNPTSTTINAGQTIQLTATITPNNTSNQGVSWTSDNSGIASVNGNGLVTAVSAGTTTIRATTADGSSRQATCTITVRQLATGITVSPTSVSIVEGGTSQLTATVSPSTTNNKEVTWTSDNNGIASVNGSGLVTAIAPGTTTIRVTTADGSNRTATCTVTVTADPNRVGNRLKEGDWVYYTDATGTRRTCRVLYDSSSSYGVEIIAMSTVKNVTLGSSTSFSTSMDSYNNAISRLNLEASAYNNSTYSTRARCVGSVPNNINSQAGMHTPLFTSSYSGRLRDTDTNYLTDWNQMYSLGIRNISAYYWLASRLVLSYSDESIFYVRLVNTSGTLSGTYLCDLNMRSNGSANGLRPVFKLRTTVKVTGGAGTSASPYTLGV